MIFENHTEIKIGPSVMNSSKNNINMINAISSEYRVILTKVLEQFDCDTDQIMQQWDKAVEESKDNLNTIMKPFLKSKGKGKRKGKKSGPKRPKSAYIFFCQEKRAEVKQANPDMKATEVIKELGAMWNEIKTTEDAKEYVNLANEDKARYAEEVENAPQVASEDEDGDDGEKKTKRSKKNTGGPKKPKSAYIFFCQEKRAEVKLANPDMKPTEITSELGRLWNKIKDTKKAQPYIELATEDKTRYEGESKSDQSGEEKTTTKKKAKKTLPKKKEVKEDQESKKKKSMSGYNLFCTEKAEEVQEQFPTLKKKDIRTKLSKMWKELKENDSDAFNEYNIRAKIFYDDIEDEAEPDVDVEVEGDVEAESKDNSEAESDDADLIRLPIMSLNNTQIGEAKDEVDEDEAELEAEDETAQPEEDPELVGARALLEYLKTAKDNTKKRIRIPKDDWVEATEGFTVSEEITEKLKKFKNAKKPITLPFLDELITLTEETIESYN